MKVAVVGGGAAGFFAALAVKENHPAAQVTILEKTNQLLAKVKVSGGGRCNVTNGCKSIAELCKAYPRGGQKLKKLFPVFNTQHTIAWFESRGVPLIEEPDGRMFPKSQSSQSIIDCFLHEVGKHQVHIKLQHGVTAITAAGNQLKLSFAKEQPDAVFDKVIITSGGSAKVSGFDWLKDLGHQIETPVPSLFTFNIPNDPVKALMGVVAPAALVSIQGTKLKSSGPLLITHWGMSGPAILKLSAFGARALAQKDYRFKFQVNWTGEINQQIVVDQLNAIILEHPKKLLSSVKPFSFPDRLWAYLLKKVSLDASKKWGETGKKDLNKLTNMMTNDIYAASGKTTFKEEFVTCGGISLDSIDLNTMQSTACKNLYFAGEVLDIDAITGGYNFQAAWTTGFVAGKLG